eukprot:CAMPEP_0179254044 /NCGR_PEP_ID=MMETSP0797-20121207/23043_1 /TAXON_ID=47934 /ORGANISM="Dinophysis acuminata, Strain DAEP01" /LENGTH=148 /DNA_ID=CAMNT_0020961925 /DNA_START=87 /DNA_END=529 /DNA_ORIENTATION=+
MHRANTYVPPSDGHLTRPRVGVFEAAAALDLLECDPAKLLALPFGGRRDKSAAKLARERYAEALASKEPTDLLDFDSPAAAPPAAAGVPAAAPGSLLGDAPGDVWPGDTVFARPAPGAASAAAAVCPDLLDLQITPAEAVGAAPDLLG